jgi:uncharacterized membrane-anchored protein
MNAKKLIEENNGKREMLTKENEAYYGDMLLYIRLQMLLSEQQSEEILMELLDHILEGQEEGKSAKEIFGEDPKGYANEIIQQLPRERKRTMIPFISEIVTDLISWLLIIRGIILLVFSQFKEVDTAVYPFVSLVYLAFLLGMILFVVWYIFNLIKKSLFQEKSSDKKNMWKAGLAGGSLMAVFIMIMKFLPNFGPSFDFSGRASLLLGALLWLGLLIAKKIRRNSERV